MDAGDGYLVGMSVLPKGMVAEEEAGAEESEGTIEDDGAEPSAGEGPWLFTLTKKARLLHRSHTAYFSCLTRALHAGSRQARAH